MATKMATRPTQGSQLPLGLQPYHMLYLSVVCTIVFGGTAYAAFTGSNLFNISEGLDRLDILNEASSSSPTSHSLFLPPKGYFANKRNIINQLFVKKAWAWNTAAFILQAVFLKSHISSTAREAAQRKKDDDAGNTTAAQKANATKQSNITSPLSLSMLRYFAATFCWVLFAGWFFGPPLMLRILAATGGECVPVNPTVAGSLLQLPTKVDATYCYQRKSLTRDSHPHLFLAGDRIGSRVAASGGIKTQWKGGHDVSGHTFILVLSALYLLEELAPFIPHLLPALSDFYPKSIWWPSNPFRAPGPSPVSTGSSKQKAVTWNSTELASLLSAIAILALVGLWLLMLTMTQIYYHTAFEKMTGLLFGLGAWLLLPKES